MTLDDFSVEYDSLTAERKKEGLRVLFTELLSDLDRHYGLIDELLIVAVAAEAEDHFGTEGLHV